VCPSPEDVQLVSALIESGKASATISHVGYKVTAQTALSKALSKERPLPVGNALLLLVLGVGFGAGAIAIIGSTSSGIWNIFWGVWLALGSVLCVMLGVERLIHPTKYRTIEARWDAMYYCHRCGNVFIPGDPKFVPAERARRLAHAGYRWVSMIVEREKNR
jgi:hypothetical protein